MAPRWGGGASGAARFCPASRPVACRRALGPPAGGDPRRGRAVISRPDGKSTCCRRWRRNESGHRHDRSRLRAGRRRGRRAGAPGSRAAGGRLRRSAAHRRVQWMAGAGREIGTIDVVLAARGIGGASAPATPRRRGSSPNTPGSTSAPPRRNVEVFVEPDGVAVLGRGLVGSASCRSSCSTRRRCRRRRRTLIAAGLRSVPGASGAGPRSPRATPARSAPSWHAASPRSAPRSCFT